MFLASSKEVILRYSMEEAVASFFMCVRK